MPIAGEVAIIGSAATRFGVMHDRGYLELLAEAARGAMADAGVEQDDVQAAWLGTAEPIIAALLGDAGTAVTEALDFAPRPVTRVSTFCCTGMEAVRAGAMAIAAGEHDSNTSTSRRQPSPIAQCSLRKSIINEAFTEHCTYILRK